VRLADKNQWRAREEERVPWLSEETQGHLRPGLGSVVHPKAPSELSTVSDSSTGDRQRCMEAGANEYLSKPVSLKELVEVIEAQLREM